ncbi:SusC/RagA family TonB-linked outer membrane protein [Pedobacter sp. L105]|uniref:SusC/RagA family TonB-linked outer membrane protein n=1 Tax=Pedobacter sp. L105 TaxID=1641871 RepID=UPI0020B13224|nr:SusC/RagA family TonB-linked outer membrane protein [Pedobacter sp. L105]
MKLTILITTIAFLQVSASTFAQRISLKGNEISLTKALQSIKKQSGYALFFNNTLVEEAGSFKINLKDATLDQALSEVLKDKPFTYTIIDKTIVIKEKPEDMFTKVMKYLAIPITIHGKVVDEKGLPIPGATVFLKDRSQASTTDVNGRFFLQHVNEKAIVVISSIGYATKELNAQADMGTISLEVSNAKLDEVVVVGYETTTRRLSTGSVSQVKGTELDQQPISNPILGLEGRVPGAFITQSAGYAGAPITVLIRGQNSLQSTTNNFTAPLYVVDGIPFNSTPVEQSAGGFGTTAFSPLNTLDPTQIETIDILKDADATAIYGSRGANGVVLITTKKGKAGNTRVNADISSGFGDVSNKIKMLGTEQYLNIRRQAFANDGVTPTVANAPDLLLWNQQAYTNFPNLLMGNTQHQTKATFDLSGGDQYTQFMLGGNFRHESTVLDANTADDADQFHMNIQHHSHDNKFGITASVNYNIDDNTIPSYNINYTNYGIAPNYPLYNSNGSLYFGTGYTNPLAAFNGTYNLKSTNMVSNMSMHYMVIPGLDIKVNGGYNYDNVFSTTITPPSASNPIFNYSPTTVMSNNYIKTYILEPQVNYTHTWGKSRLTAIVGGTWQETQYVQPYFVLGTFTNIQLATSLSSLNILSKSSAYTDFRYDSRFARLEYEWDGKYLASGNFRRDGSSRFGDDKPYGNFGSGALAWIFSKENFITANLPWLSFGKLKTSYGTVGNDKSLLDYSYLSTYAAGQPYGPTSSLAPSRIQNQSLQWEETTKLDAALELGFIHDRIFFSADVYRNRTSHLLASTAIPTQTGFGSYSGNLPDGAVVQNQGLELELSTVNIKNKGFTWTTSFNFTAPQNKLLSFPNLLSSSYANSLVVGQPLNLRTVYHFTGFVNGIATAQDVNGDGVITSGIAANGKGDYIIDGSSDPKFYGGLDNTFSYKGFQFNFLFQFVKRTATRGDQNFVAYPGLGYNIPVSYLDVPLKYSATSGSAATNAFNYYQGSDAAVQDASFIRLKNVSLAYNVPAMWAKKLKMSALQFYLHGQNLLTFTKYKGLDPETLSTQLPTLRMMVAGIKTTF